MAKSTLLFLLAATIFALPAFSATAQIHHILAAPPLHALIKKHPHHAPPHSTTTKKKHPHHVAAHTHRAAAPSPGNGKLEVPPPESYPGPLYASAEKCLEKLTEECGFEIFRGIFGNGAVSDQCCVKLVAMGRRCHRKILKATVRLPEMSKREKKLIKMRDAKIWSECVLVSDALKFGNSPSPSPK
ncbi:hypothetical protein DH2020_048425 [Rehmannia glutinosa]|uniref:Prolamin-like domain-containing protein n=1 Tax=Rehmannia glutinosa TaxID=99300 RepID=A0ABR0U603_REHGL